MPQFNNILVAALKRRWPQTTSKRPITYENNVNDFSASKIIMRLSKIKLNCYKMREKRIWIQAEKVTGDHLI